MFETLVSAIGTVTATDVVTDSWKSTWTWIFGIGIGSFYLLVVVMIPLGLRDLIQLLASLKQDENGDH
jgi:hypothetical protein